MSAKYVNDALAALRAQWANNEAIREAAKEPMRARLATAKSFDGHICAIPSAEKRRLRELWLCECNQWWELVIYDNNRSWRMIGKRVVSIDPNPNPGQGRI